MLWAELCCCDCARVACIESIFVLGYFPIFVRWFGGCEGLEVGHGAVMVMMMLLICSSPACTHDDLLLLIRLVDDHKLHCNRLH